MAICHAYPGKLKYVLPCLLQLLPPHCSSQWVIRENTEIQTVALVPKDLSHTHTRVQSTTKKSSYRSVIHIFEKYRTWSNWKSRNCKPVSHIQCGLHIMQLLVLLVYSEFSQYKDPMIPPLNEKSGRSCPFCASVNGAFKRQVVSCQ